MVLAGKPIGFVCPPGYLEWNNPEGSHRRNKRGRSLDQVYPIWLLPHSNLVAGEILTKPVR